MTNLYDLPNEILVEADGPIRIVTLNRPEDRNPASTAMLFALTDLARRLDADEDARAVVITGAGKAFSAGGDFQHFVRSSRDPDVSRATLDNSRAFITAMLALRLPVVAAINGPAVGFGATLAALCDLVLIAEDAYISEPHVNIGLILGDGISITWPLFMGLLKAKEYILTGDRIPAAEAVTCGLANRVVAKDALMPDALALAHRLAAQPREALQQSKAILNGYVEAQMATTLETVLARQFDRTQSAEHAAIVQGMIDRQERNQLK
jgi:enoyl-CoA hydratase